MRVIGTAGHVDHGKTTLVTALTGINTDRLKEEQEREMTIDLGFAWMTLPGGEEVGIVDVPGHRDFIENMLAGVSGIDAALLVIAADEGVMPQTREHLAILDLLQIPTGLVVLNKIDLVEDTGWLELVEADIRKALQGTVLEAAPILRVSARTRAGFPELLKAIETLFHPAEGASLPAHADLGRPRLPVDRAFTITGFGTVVTGTLADGSLAAGDEVELLPSGLPARIRGLQTHKKKEDRAEPGGRTAINLSGVNVDQVRRGDVVAHPGQYHPTRRVDVRVRLLPDLPAPLLHAAEVKMYLGSSETIGRVRVLGAENLQLGDTGWLQVELREPVVAVRGDRFILRRPSPGETLGGGTIVDPQPAGRHKRFDEQVIRGLEAMSTGTPAEVLVQASLALGPASEKDLLKRSRLSEAAGAEALQELSASGQLLPLDDLLIARPQWEALRSEALKVLEAFHHSNPLRRGMPREELKSRLKLNAKVHAALMKSLSAANVLVENGALAALPGFEVHFSGAQQSAINDLLARFQASPFGPPPVKECQAAVGEEVFAALVDSGELVQVSPEVVFRRDDYERMRKMIRDALQQKGTITLAEVRDLLNTSRRYVQALLEHLDAIGATIRDGDARRMGK